MCIFRRGMRLIAADLRQHIAVDCPLLDAEIEGRGPAHAVIESRSMPAPINANTASVSTRDASARFGKALQYRAARSGASAASSDDEGRGIGGDSDPPADGGEFSELLARMQAASSNGTALSDSSGTSRNGAGTHEPARMPGHNNGAEPPQHSNGAAAKRPQQPAAGRPKRSLPSLPISAPQRVQSAMAAAQEYRQRRAASSPDNAAAGSEPSLAASTASGKSKVTNARSWLS